MTNCPLSWLDPDDSVTTEFADFLTFAWRTIPRRFLWKKDRIAVYHFRLLTLRLKSLKLGFCGWQFLDFNGKENELFTSVRLICSFAGWNCITTRMKIKLKTSSTKLYGSTVFAFRQLPTRKRTKTNSTFKILWKSTEILWFKVVKLKFYPLICNSYLLFDFEEKKLTFRLFDWIYRSSTIWWNSTGTRRKL